MKVAGKLSVVVLMVFFFPCLDSFSCWGCVTTNRTDSAKKKHISTRSCLYIMISIACDGIIAVRSRYLVLPIPYLFSEWKSRLNSPVFSSLLISFSWNIYECCSPTIAEPSCFQHHKIALGQRITTLFCSWSAETEQGCPWPHQDYTGSLRQNQNTHLHLLSPVSLIDSDILRCSSSSTNLDSTRRASCSKQKQMNLSNQLMSLSNCTWVCICLRWEKSFPRRWNWHADENKQRSFYN